MGERSRDSSGRFTAEYDLYANDALTPALEHSAGAAQRLVGEIGQIVLATAGFAAAKEAIIGLGSRWEDTGIRIAGALKAFNMADTFQGAQKQASMAMQMIEQQAAALPGEAEQYVEVFQTALPKAIEAGLDSVSKIVDFTDRYTAVAVSNGVDAAQAGRDLALMLGGQAGMHVKMWTVLSAHIGGTAKQFNALSASVRQQKIEAAISKYGEALDASAQTWGAKMGELQSRIKEIVRLGTADLFKTAKDTLGGINAWLEKNRQMLIDMVHRAGEWAKSLAKVALLNTALSLGTGKGILGLLTSGPMGNVLGTKSKLAGGEEASFWRSNVSLGNLTKNIVLMGSAAIVAYSATKAFHMIMEDVGGVGSRIRASLDEALIGVNQFLQAAGIIKGPFESFTDLLANGMVVAIERAAEAMSGLVSIINAVVKTLESMPGYKKLFDANEGFFTLKGWKNVANNMMATALDNVGPKFRNQKMSYSDALNGGKSVTDTFMDNVFAEQRNLGRERWKQSTPFGTGAIYGPPNEMESGTHAKHVTNNDFRGSRFDITQEFGDVDEDRVALAFAQNLSGVIQTRLTSGMAPLFSGM